MFAVLEVVGAIVGLNVLGFGALYIATKVSDLKLERQVAANNSKALHAYRVRYGVEGVEV